MCKQEECKIDKRQNSSLKVIIQRLISQNA
jgi:hypothetical protein